MIAYGFPLFLLKNIFWLSFLSQLIWQEKKIASNPLFTASLPYIALIYAIISRRSNGILNKYAK
jgi:heme O synthase-like polyprenyltransferase